MYNNYVFSNYFVSLFIHWRCYNYDFKVFFYIVLLRICCYSRIFEIIDLNRNLQVAFDFLCQNGGFVLIDGRSIDLIQT